jgi:hypothetical protein
MQQEAESSSRIVSNCHTVHVATTARAATKQAKQNVPQSPMQKQQLGALTTTALPSENTQPAFLEVLAA